MHVLFQRHGPALGCSSFLIVLEWFEHDAFFLAGVVPLYLIWLSLAVVATLISRRADLLRLRVVNAGIWLLALLIMAGSVPVLRSMAHQSANMIVEDISRYKRVNGHYPKTLADAGVNTSYFTRNDKVSYRLDNGEPSLHYPDVLTPFDRYIYDFKTGSWEFHPD